MSDGISMAERRPPRPSGIDGVKGEIERLRADAIAAVRERAEQFFAEFECNPSNKVLADWFVPRCWREIEYVFMLGEEIRRYGLLFDRTHITALAKHLQQEAEHYEAVGRIIEHLGGAVPTEVPPSARVWSAYLWDCLDRHPLSAIAAWYMSESGATGTFDATLAAGDRYALPEIVRTYQEIIKDEKFHLGLGRLLLDRYVNTEEDLDEVLRSLRGMAGIMMDSTAGVAALPT